MAYADQTTGRASSKVDLVGGGIASLATAVFMIRDGDSPGCNITIFEEPDKIGGSLDGSGTPETSNVLRGGRMIESKASSANPPMSACFGATAFRSTSRATSSRSRCRFAPAVRS